MNGYPELDKNNKQEGVSVTPSNNKSTISNTYNSMRSKSNAVINSALTKKVNSIKAELKKVPEIYKNLRNNLTVSNNKIKKNMEEHIANSGNHTASGYALSERMNNQNEYLKAIKDINTEEKNKITELNDKIRAAYDEAQTAKINASGEYDYKELQDVLKETERVDKFNFDTAKYNSDYQLDYDKLNEEKRLNDIKIKKTENDIMLDNEANKRESEKHSLEMEYEPEIYKLKTEGLKKEQTLTDAKINKTNSETQKVKSTSSKTQSNSKMSAKDIAESVRLQAGTMLYDEKGNEYLKVDDLKAYAILMAWKKKFGLTDQVVNDAAIYLGIQGYL